MISWPHISLSWGLVLAIAGVLPVLGKLADDHYVTSRARDRFRLWLIWFFVYLDDLKIPRVAKDVANSISRFSSNHWGMYWMICGIIWVLIPPWSGMSLILKYCYIIVPMMAIWIGLFLLLTSEIVRRTKSDSSAVMLAFFLPIIASIIIWHISWKAFLPLYTWAIDLAGPEPIDPEMAKMAGLTLLLVGYAHYRVMFIAVFPIALIALILIVLVVLRHLVLFLRWGGMHFADKSTDPAKSPFAFSAALLSIAITLGKLAYEIIR